MKDSGTVLRQRFDVEALRHGAYRDASGVWIGWHVEPTELTRRHLAGLTELAAIADLLRQCRDDRQQIRQSATNLLFANV